MKVLTRSYMRKAYIFIFILSSNLCLAEVLINVRGYQFAPFVTSDNQKNFSGATIELIDELNKVQSKYKFVFKETSSKRRYGHLEEEQLDMIFFEDKAWGWQKFNVVSSKVFAHGGEVFFALKQKGRAQDYFTKFEAKRLVGVLGFHYKFANYIADEKYLKKNYNMILTSTPEFVMDLILKKRGDIGIITESLLRKMTQINPELKEKLLVSKNYDQKYNHTILIRKDAPISKQEIDLVLKKLKESGALSRVLKKYGIKESIKL